MPHLFNSINNRRGESYELIIQLNMCIKFINPDVMAIKYVYYVKSNIEEIRLDNEK